MPAPTATPAPARRGHTLVELLTVVAVLAIAAALAGPSLAPWLDRQRLLAQAQALRSDVQLARSEAAKRRQPVWISFHAGDDASGPCYVIGLASAEACACRDAPDDDCPGAHARVKAVRLDPRRGLALASNVPRLRMDPTLGTVTPTATLTLAHARGWQLRQVVNLMGRVHGCAWPSALPGHPPC